MSKPQFDKPQAANFTTVEASNGAKLEVWFDRINIRPYANTLLIRVGRGYLRLGDTLTIRLGDRRQGSPGYRLQPTSKRSGAPYLGRCVCDIRVLRAAEAAGFRSCAGPGSELEGDPPSLAVVGEPFRLALVAEDMWGNPTPTPADARALSSHPVRGLPARLALKKRRWSACDRKPLVAVGRRPSSFG